MTEQLTGAQLVALMAPLNKNRVASRRQGNRNLSYLEAWDVRATLIRVFGFGNWSADVTETKVLDIKRTDMPPEGDKKAYERIESCAMVTVRLAIKTAASDALKRCAMNLGTQFGLSLYDDGALVDVVRILLEPEQKKAYEEEVTSRAAATQPAPQTQEETVPA